MVNTATRQVNAYWNSHLCISEYDEGHAEGIGVELDDAVWREEFRRYLPAPPARVADIGCGTGFASVLLAEMGYTVTGLDQSENMLREARQKAAARQLDVRFVQGNVMAPQLPPDLAHQRFDIVLAR